MCACRLGVYSLPDGMRCGMRANLDVSYSTSSLPRGLLMSCPRHISFLLILSTFLITTSGCGRHDSDEKYFLVTANVQLPYWREAKSGFMQAADQLKVQATMVGPDSYDPKAELAAFDDAV